MSVSKDMRKPENKEKFEAAIEAMITFYGKRDKKMVAEVLSQEAEKARALEVEWWERRLKREERVALSVKRKEKENPGECQEVKIGETRTDN